MKKKSIIIISVIIFLILVSFFVFRGKEDTEYVTASVEKGDIVQTVSETGTVKAAKEVELNFLQAGKISDILVEIGDKVEKDQVLAKLDYTSLSIQEKEAQAALDIAKADLSKLLEGASSEDIKVSQASVEQAYKNYLAAKNELEKTQNSVSESISQSKENLNDLESDDSESVTAYEQAVSIAKTSLSNTKATYSQAVNNKKDSLLVTIDDKIAKAKSSLSDIDRIINDDDAEGLLSASNSYYLSLTENLYSESQDLIDSAKSSFSQAKLSRDVDDLYGASDDCIDLLQKVFDSLVSCHSALENSIVSSDFTQSEIDAFKTTVTTDQTTINTGISSVQTGNQNLKDAVLNYDTNLKSAQEALLKAEADLDDAIIKAKNSLSSAQTNGDQQIAAAQAKVDSTLEAWNVAKANLNKTVSPARSQDISLYQAKVKQSEANLELIKQKIEDSIIKAPIDGTITKVNYEVGEQIAGTGMASPVISLLGKNNFEIELDISEADIYKVRIGDPVVIDLDAFGTDVKFSGMVSFIEPAETVIQDVIYYKVTVKFVKDSEEKNSYYESIKSGMTANATITTAKKKDVLFVPSRAILEKNGSGKYVRILDNNEMIEKKVEVGLRGDDGVTEILSGLNEGEEVVTQIKEKK